MVPMSRFRACVVVLRLPVIGVARIIFSRSLWLWMFVMSGLVMVVCSSLDILSMRVRSLLLLTILRIVRVVVVDTGPLLKADLRTFGANTAVVLLKVR